MMEDYLFHNKKRNTNKEYQRRHHRQHIQIGHESELMRAPKMSINIDASIFKS